MQNGTTTTPPLRIAIIGGGIGGLYAALSIHHHCGALATITVYEQAPEFKEIGAGVGLAVNAARLVHKLGLGAGLNAAAGHRNGVWIAFRRGDDGGEIITVRADDKGEVRQAPVARSDLLDLLRRAVEERGAAGLRTGKRLAGLEDRGRTVGLRFEDGAEAEADVVVGADGIHSAVRGKFVVDNAVYSGRVAYRATIPIEQIQEWWPFESYSVMWAGKHRHFLVFPIAANKTLNVVAFVNRKAEDAEGVVESWVSTCERSEVEEAYKDFEPNCKRLIALMPEQPSRWKINDREPLHRWNYMDGKAILLGDAAHAMLPHMGAGAGQAIEDGWVLGRALGELVNHADPKLDSLQSCAEFYQKVRLPRAQKVQQKSREAGATYDMQTPEMTDKSVDECCTVIADKLSKQMKFVWEADLDSIYDDAKRDELPVDEKMS